MQASIAQAILETVHHLLQGHVDYRPGSDAMRTLGQLLDRALHEDPVLAFAIEPSRIRLGGEALPTGSVNQELGRIFLREGLEGIVFHRVPGSEELAVWIDMLRSHYRRRVASDAEQHLQPRLLSAGFRHLNFSFSLTRRLQNQASEFGPRMDPGFERQKLTWEEEAVLESCRHLDVDLGLTVLEDIEKHVHEEDWRSQGIEVLSGLVEDLVSKKQYRTCLPILDRAQASRLPSVIAGMDACLAGFRTHERLEEFLRALSTGFDPALCDFLKRLGPGIAPFLLTQEDQYPSASLHSLLEYFIKQDTGPIQQLLDCGNSKIEHRVLSYLLESGQALPVRLLEQLTRSDTEWIQNRAMQLLVAQHPTWLSEDRAMHLLESEQEAMRIQALQQMRRPGHEDQAEALELWFQRKQRKMGFAERKVAFLTLVTCLEDRALAFLQPFLDIEPQRRRRSDLDNVLCAIQALGLLTDRRAHDMLIALSHSDEDAVQQMALHVLAD